MVQLGGSSSLYADFPTADITLKGPWNRASSFLDARVVFIFEASRYTRSPGWYCFEGLTCLSCCCFILSAAFSRFCFAIFHVSLNRSMYSAAEWFVVVCPSIPLNGFRPVVIMNGENPVAECCLSLWQNCAIGNQSTQSFCFSLTYIRRYSSNSWFTRSVCPSVWG